MSKRREAKISGSGEAAAANSILWFGQSKRKAGLIGMGLTEWLAAVGLHRICCNGVIIHFLLSTGKLNFLVFKEKVHPQKVIGPDFVGPVPVWAHWPSRAFGRVQIGNPIRPQYNGLGDLLANKKRQNHGIDSVQGMEAMPREYSIEALLHMGSDRNLDDLFSMLL